MSHYYIPTSNRFGWIDDEIFRFAQAFNLKVAMSFKDEPMRILCMNGHYFHINISDDYPDQVHVYQEDGNGEAGKGPYIANRQTLFTLLYKLKDET